MESDLELDKELDKEPDMEHRERIFVDLHIHSTASDGSCRPEEIVSLAREKGIGIISLTNHESLDDSEAILPLAEAAGIKAVNGVELSSSYNGKGCDILGYAFDLSDPDFRRFVRENRKRMDDISLHLLKLMKKDYDFIDIDEYEKFEYDRTKGGWKCLHYLASLGFDEDFKKCNRFYNDYGIWDPENKWFLDPDVVIEAIHKAGGYAILAHPGVTFKKSDPDDFHRNLEKINEMGIDGVECFHTHHTEELTAVCVEWCRKNGKLITAGSDFHGSFHANEMKGHPLSRLSIDPLLR